MTGIERLREFVAGISPITVVCVVTRTSYDREHMEVAGKRLRDFLANIANQIEREQGERVSRVRILAVVTKMERHVLGHEGMEDSPVARWARELREALAGHEDEEVEDVATVRADAMEAWRWVREHGGLEKVRALNWFGSECACIITGRDHGEDMDANEMLDSLRRRLMPEGCEWPRFEDGARLAFEDKLPDFAHTIYKTVQTVKFLADGTAELTNGGGSANVTVIVRPGERVKRPAPKDSWERLEDDAKKDACDYFWRGKAAPCNGCPREHSDDCAVDMAIDLVRRAKALAERERSE